MYTSDALAYANNSPTELARLVGVTSQAISMCGDVFPERLAARLEKASGGVMVHDVDFYVEYEKKRRAELAKKRMEDRDQPANAA